MTELIIDGLSVVLPDNVSWNITEENPFFTKSGKFTIDPELSLKNPQNAKIYKHLDRINNKTVVPQNRPARLIVDNDVILNGTEIINEITDTAVKIQLVSGESELNYFIGGDKKINELDLGSIKGDDKYAFIPVYSITEETFFNCPSVWQQEESRNPVLSPSLNLMVHPFFYHVINRIIEALGYTVSSNVFETSDFKYLCIVQESHHIDYNKMLPDFTVSEFFEEVEKLFNVVFLIKKNTKNVDIVFKHDYYDQAEKIVIDQVLDSYSQKIDKENKQDYSNANIGYDLPSDEYFDFQNMASEILNEAMFVDMKSWTFIATEINNTVDKKTLKNKIFTSEASNTQYICVEEQNNETSVFYSKKVNIFRPVLNNPESEDIDIKFKIIPASMRVFEIPVHNYGDDPRLDPLYYMITQMPAISTAPYVWQEDIIDIQKTIEEGQKTEESGSDVIQLVFYTGYQTIFEKDAVNPRRVDFPVPFVDYLWEDTRQFGERTVNDNNLSLRLDDPHGMKALYDSSLKIDTTREYTFKFIHKGKLDVKSIFVINNKEFVCKEIRRTINTDGFDKIIESDFYAINI
jgi:hypothetical protein